MRFLMLSGALIVSFSAAAEPLPASRDAYALGLAGGTGQDWERVRVLAEEEEFRDGVHFFRFRVASRSLAGYHLPQMEVLEKCDFHRASGGVVGDYKPKAVQPTIMVGGGTYAGLLFQRGEYKDDYNDNPVIQRFQFMRGDTRIVLSESSRRAFEIFCAQNGGGRHYMPISWSVSSLCRWKPENWHKPGHFPFEYRPELNARISRRILTICEP